jgi:hypothetical protein
MRQTKSLVHFEILYVYSKVSLWDFLGFLWTKSKSRVRAFFWLSVGRKLSLVSEKKKAKSRCFGLWLAFFQINNFSFFEKDALRVRSNIFETFRFAPRKKNKSVKEFVRFSTTDVFVPVSQLSTRDLFDFLENLKIKQDIFLSWISRQVRINRTTSIMISLFQIIFRNSFQEGVVSWIFGIFTKSIVVSILDFFWHISFRKMFELLTCKRNHNY